MARELSTEEKDKLAKMVSFMVETRFEIGELEESITDTMLHLSLDLEIDYDLLEHLLEGAYMKYDRTEQDVVIPTVDELLAIVK